MESWFLEPSLSKAKDIPFPQSNSVILPLISRTLLFFEPIFVSLGGSKNRYSKWCELWPAVSVMSHVHSVLCFAAAFCLYWLISRPWGLQVTYFFLISSYFLWLIASSEGPNQEIWTGRKWFCKSSTVVSTMGDKSSWDMFRNWCFLIFKHLFLFFLHIVLILWYPSPSVQCCVSVMVCAV